jgi:hypothetical protein
MKLCSKCGNAGKFYKDATKKDGLHSICAVCHTISYQARIERDPQARVRMRETSKQWKELNREHCKKSQTNSTLRAKYGITLQDYDDMLALQNNGCKVCMLPPTTQRLHVDHCHTTGKVRGLLCQACNVSIGKMRESPELLRALATYIEENRN